MSAPLAYLLTWTTHGCWLPGDARGWVKAGETEIQDGDESTLRKSQRNLSQPPVKLSEVQRQIVNETVRQHCDIRGWTLHAVNVRTNHVHVVVTADVEPEVVLNQLESWCSRKLNEDYGEKRRWWTNHGSTRWINDKQYFRNAINYVENQ